MRQEAGWFNETKDSFMSAKRNLSNIFKFKNADIFN